MTELNRKVQEVADLSDSIWNADIEIDMWRVYADMLAEVLHAEGYRKIPTILTAEELDALPVDSVVVDSVGTPRTKRYGDSVMGAGWTHAGRGPLSARELADGKPMLVVHTPART